MRTFFPTLFLLLSVGFLWGAAPPLPEQLELPILLPELLQRVKKDHEIRHRLIECMQNQNRSVKPSAPGLDFFQQLTLLQIGQEMRSVDAENTRWLKSVIAKHGWPTRTLVGERGVDAVWLLVQHADADPLFQRACLDRLTKLPAHEVSPRHVAYLTDRVLLAEGKKQRYGTQFQMIDGKWVVKPLESPEDGDTRRAAVDLPSLAEYQRQLEAQMRGSKKIEP